MSFNLILPPPSKLTLTVPSPWYTRQELWIAEGTEAYKAGLIVLIFAGCGASAVAIFGRMLFEVFRHRKYGSIKQWKIRC